MNRYDIQLRGQVDEADLNRMSPLYMALESSDTAVSHFSVVSDQSGLIGLMRHLHGLGYTLLSISCDSETTNQQLEEAPLS